MATPDSSKNVILRTSFFLTPSAQNICIICRADIREKYPKVKDNSRKKRLWSAGGEKTNICLKLEEYIGDVIDQYKDFQSICSGCSSSVESHLQVRHNKEVQLKKGREEIEEKFLRSRLSRKRLHTDDEPPSKKQLVYVDPKEAQCHVAFTTANGQDEFDVSLQMKEMIVALCSGETLKVLKLLDKYFSEDVKSFCLKKNQKSIEEEIINLTCQANTSSFKLKDVNDIESIRYDSHFKELKNKAPILTNIVSDVAINPRIDQRNKQKTSSLMIPTIVNVIGILLFARNQTMTTIPIRNMLILRRGRADKACFERLQKLHITVSHVTSLRKQLDLTKDLEETVSQQSALLQQHGDSMKALVDHTLQSDHEIPMEIENSISSMKLFSVGADESFLQEGALNPNVEIIDLSKSSSSKASSEDISLSDESVQLQEISYELDQLNITVDEKSILDSELFNDNVEILPELQPTVQSIKSTFDPKFVFVVDNVDVVVKPRQFSRNHSTRDLHMYNLIAVTNRVSIPHDLIGKKSATYENTSDIPLEFFLPTSEDEVNLKEEIKILIARDLSNYVEDLGWMKSFVIKHIEHKHSKEMAEVSNVMPLGIINECETTTEGIINIMQAQHKLVPGNDAETLVRMLSVGDLLTVERQQNAQQDMRDSPTPSKQLVGLIPALADFHSYGNFLEVVWHILYNVSSSGDIGSLFQARNFLNTRSVPSSPMKDLNACEDLLFRYSDALILSAFYKYRESHDVNDTGDEASNQQQMTTILNDLFEVFMVPQRSDSGTPDKKSLLCPYCSKSFKRSKTLREHIKSHPSGSKVSEKVDGVLNYSKNALVISYLAKNFCDARKHGDGERILRMYKIFLLYFKLDGRHKYAYQTLHLLAQVSYLLPPSLAYELKWNRFVNTKGKVDSNVEIDRHLEHQNKFVKLELSRYQGKLTDKSISRCGRSYSKINNIMSVIDKELNVHTPSGRHTKKDLRKDVLDLADQYHSSNIFKRLEGRHHTQFPGFPPSYLDTLDLLEFKKWTFKKLNDYRKMSIYKFDDIVIQNIEKDI